MLFTPRSRRVAKRGGTPDAAAHPVQAARVAGQEALANAPGHDRRAVRQQVRSDIAQAKEARAKSRGLGGQVRAMAQADREGGIGTAVRRLARGRGHRGRG